MTNKEYVIKNKLDDLFDYMIEEGDCGICRLIGCNKYCNSSESPSSCRATLTEWLNMEHGVKPIKLHFGEIVEVNLPHDTQLCYYAGSELGIHYFTNSKKTCDQIKSIGLKSISKADLIVLLDRDLPLCVTKVGD